MLLGRRGFRLPDDVRETIEKEAGATMERLGYSH